jgi:hypothetical protein
VRLTGFFLTAFLGLIELIIVYGCNFIVPEEKPTISVTGTADKGPGR